MAAPLRRAEALPWVLAIATIGAQIAYPLLRGESLRWLTIATVTLFFLASVTHAVVHRGAAWAAGLVVVSGGVALAAESVGVHTGYPFGSYTYADTLGPKLLGVPLIVPMAWTMMAYPALLVARRITRRYAPLVGAVALTGWDVFLDPQMVAGGHWTWAFPDPSLPGVPGIPLTNYAGWFAVSLVLMTLLHLVLPRDRPGTRTADGPPVLLFLWTYVGSVVGNLFFFDRPSVALAGGVLMGLVVAPFAWVSWSGRR